MCGLRWQARRRGYACLTSTLPGRRPSVTRRRSARRRRIVIARKIRTATRTRRRSAPRRTSVLAAMMKMITRADPRGTLSHVAAGHTCTYASVRAVGNFNERALCSSMWLSLGREGLQRACNSRPQRRMHPLQGFSKSRLQRRTQAVCSQLPA